MASQRVLVIGSGHIGRAAATEIARYHEVTTLSRSTEPAVDLAHPDTLRAALTAGAPYDALVIAVGHVRFAPIAELTDADFVSGFEGKVLPQIQATLVASDVLNDGGSVTLTTGILAREHIRGSSVAAMANGAVESFVMAASRELPRGLRLNAVSPTWLTSAPAYAEAFAGMPPVTPERVGGAFLRSVASAETGRIFALDE